MKTIEQIKSVISKKKYPFNENGINLIGVRTIGNTPNKFDDEFYVIGNGIFKCYKCTTDPGTYWLEHPMNIDGTGIMVEGYYKGLWKKGLHQGKYPALAQANPVKLYRDNNKDNIFNLDPNTIVKGMFGVNNHHAGLDSVQVDKWSAACQVLARLSDWNEYWEIIINSKQEIFDYILINERDFYL